MDIKEYIDKYLNIDEYKKKSLKKFLDNLKEERDSLEVNPFLYATDELYKEFNYRVLFGQVDKQEEENKIILKPLGDAIIETIYIEEHYDKEDPMKIINKKFYRVLNIFYNHKYGKFWLNEEK